MANIFYTICVAAVFFGALMTWGSWKFNREIF